MRLSTSQKVFLITHPSKRKFTNSFAFNFNVKCPHDHNMMKVAPTNSPNLSWTNKEITSASYSKSTHQMKSLEMRSNKKLSQKTVGKRIRVSCYFTLILMSLIQGTISTHVDPPQQVLNAMVSHVKMLQNDRADVNVSVNPTAFPSSSPGELADSLTGIFALDDISEKIEPESTSAPLDLPSVPPSPKPSFKASESPSLKLSNSPSFSPTLSLSVLPSISNSEMPSVNSSGKTIIMESSTPTSVPSAHSSIEPSFRPSVEPSPGLSESPSLLSSVKPSPNPSSMPSLLSSLEPSSRSSYFPTEKPSIVVSLAPSIEPSSFPSSHSSQQPSIFSSQIPTHSPSISPSKAPSASPSLLSSQSPTTVPTANPSMSSSSKPTSNPSTSPTVNPTRTPSQSPSNIPSAKPSFAPTKTPSVHPSEIPSFSPTTECHDNKTYRNPISGQACGSHNGLDCTQFHHFGLSENQVLELLDNCPISCGTNCGHTSVPSDVPSSQPSNSPTMAPKNFSTFIIFEMRSLPSLLTNETVDAFESVSLKYFSGVFDTFHPESSTLLESVKLTSQEILDLENRRLEQNYDHDENQKYLRSRDLQNDMDILLTVTVNGTTLFHKTSTIQNVLISSIVNWDYTMSLRAEHSFFAKTMISATTMFPTEITDEVHSDSHSTRNHDSMTGILLGTVGTLALAASGAGFLFFRQQRIRQSSGGFMTSQKNIVDLSEIGNSDRLFRRPAIFNFEQGFLSSPNRSVSSPRAVLSDGSSTTGSRSSTYDVNEDVPTTQMIAEEPIEEEEEEDDDDVIPPMIVIENIDCDEDVIEDKKDLEGQIKSSPCIQLTSDPEGARGRHVRHLEASPGFAAAISLRRRCGTNGSLADMLSNLSDSQALEKSKAINIIQGKETINNYAVKQAYNEPSPSSNGSQTSNRSMERPHLVSKNSLRSMESLQDSERIGDGNSVKSEAASSFALDTDTEDPYGSVPHSRKRSGSDYSRDNSTSNASSRSTRRARTMNRIPRDYNQNSNDMDAISLDRISLGARTLPKRPCKRDILDVGDQSVMSGLTYSTYGAGSAASIRVDVQAIPESGSLSGSPHHSRTSSGNSIPTNHFNRRWSEEIQPNIYSYTFHAPSSGKLGIIIESSKLLGPTIHTVKDYSPLFGKVQKGDKLVEVDGESTASMTTQQVTNLLARKRLEKSGRGTILVKVISTTEKVGIESESKPVLNVKETIDADVPYSYRRRGDSNDYKGKLDMTGTSGGSESEHMQLKSFSHEKEASYYNSRESPSSSSKSLSGVRQDSGLSNSDVTYNATDEEDLHVESVASNESFDSDSFHLIGGGLSDCDTASEDEDDYVRHHYVGY